MSDTAEQQEPDNEAKPDEGVQESEESRELERLYDKVPKLLAHITKGNAERHVALDRLLTLFEKINRQEEALLGEGEAHTPINLTRVYDLAVAGGGAGDIEELKTANAAFAHENEILAETIEGMTFQIKRMRDQAADELIQKGELEAVNVGEAQKAVASIRGTINDIQNRLAFLHGSNASHGKPLHEQMVESIAGLDDISAEILKAVPRRTTVLGRALRRFGFAYDYKDMEAARHLVGTVLKANKALADVIDSLTPAQEQLAKLQEVTTMLELLAGHDDRNTPRYQDALDQIARLEGKVERLQAGHGTLDEIEERIKAGQADFDAQQEAQQGEITAINETIAILKLEIVALESEHPEKLKEKITAQEDQIARGQKQTIALGEELAQEKREHAQSKTALAGEIQALTAKIRDIEDGLLVEKLEYEIATLRGMTERAEKQAEQECEKRKAFEDRVELWVTDSEKLQKEIETWRGRTARVTANFSAKAAAVATAAAAAGFGATYLVDQAPPGKYWLAGVGASMLLGLFAGMIKADFNNKVGRQNTSVMRSALGTSAKFGCIGVVASALYLPIVGRLDSQYAADTAHAAEKYRQEILEACANSPCMIVPQEDGTTKFVRLADKYAGESVILTFPDDSGNKSAPSQIIMPKALVVPPSVSAP